MFFGQEKTKVGGCHRERYDLLTPPRRKLCATCNVAIRPPLLLLCLLFVVVVVLVFVIVLMMALVIVVAIALIILSVIPVADNGVVIYVAAFRTSIFPVTEAVMSAVRYSCSFSIATSTFLIILSIFPVSRSR